MIRSADVSEDGTYRYTLTRRWAPGDAVVFVMLNPSTADGTEDDPTIRRCVGFAQSWGYGGLVVVNLFAVRATDPALITTFIDPVGPENNTVLVERARGRVVVAAWGASVPRYWAARPPAVLSALRAVSDVHHLGLTKGGHPRHPLYLRGDTRPEPWDT